MPYHFAVDLLQRQALGEVMAYVWMPLILYFVERMFAGMPAITGLSLSYFCLVVSHLPATIIFSMFLPIYVGVYAFGSGSRRVLLQFLVSILIGLGLSGIYIIPALLSLQYVHSDWLTSSFFQYDKWFILSHWPEVFSSDYRRLFLILIITTSGWIILWSIAWQCNRNSPVRKRLIIWLLFAGGAWFLMTPLSRIIWKVIPFLQMIQFPWRVAVVLDLAISGTVVLAMRCVTIAKKWTSLLSILIVGLLLMLSMEISTRRFVEYWWLSRSDENQENLAAFVRSGCDAPPYIPVGVKMTEGPDGCAQIDIVGTSRVAFDPANGEVKALLWRPREIILDVDLLMETDLVVHQLMFPGWRASITGSNTSLKILQNGSTGLLEVTAPPGHYQLVLKLEALWQEVVGAILSGVSCLVIIIHEVLRKVR
jgi:hypothetical protein